MAKRKPKDIPGQVTYYAKKISETQIELQLPWPPTVNHYWGRMLIFPPEDEIVRKAGANGFIPWLRKNSRAQEFLTSEAKDFRQIVLLVVQAGKCALNWECALTMKVYAYPPDNRIRDLSNLYKALEDSLQAARVFKNDSQIVKHMAYKDVQTVSGGALKVSIERRVEAL